MVVGVPSDLNTLDIVVSPGRNSWSAGERGGGGGVGRDKEGKRWEAVRYTDNGIRLKHSEGERKRPPPISCLSNNA